MSASVPAPDHLCAHGCGRDATIQHASGRVFCRACYEAEVGSGPGHDCPTCAPSATPHEARRGQHPKETTILNALYLKTDLAGAERAEQALCDILEELHEARALLEQTRAQTEQLPRAIALTLAYYGDPSSAVGDKVPQEVWDALHAEGLIETVRIYGDGGQTQITEKGRDALVALAAADPAPETSSE